jgi:hypothetical protein
MTKLLFLPFSIAAGARGGFAGITGSWPGEEQKEQEQEEEKEKKKDKPPG